MHNSVQLMLIMLLNWWATLSRDPCRVCWEVGRVQNGDKIDLFQLGGLLSISDHVVLLFLSNDLLMGYRIFVLGRKILR